MNSFRFAYLFVVCLLVACDNHSDSNEPAMTGSGAPVVDENTGLADQDNAYLFVGASIDGSTGAVEFRPTRSLLSARQLTTEPGDFTLVLMGYDGAMLASVAFDMQPLSDGASASFNVPLPQPTAPIASIELWKSDTKLAEKSGSLSMPRVDIVWPTEGEQVSVSDLELRWQAHDDDADDLLSFVYISSDDGKSWSAIGSNILESAMRPVDGQVSTSDNVRFFVTVTDGVNAAFARSDKFSVTPSQ